MEPSLGAGDRDETTSDGAACGVTSTVEEPTSAPVVVVPPANGGASNMDVGGEQNLDASNGTADDAIPAPPPTPEASPAWVQAAAIFVALIARGTLCPGHKRVPRAHGIINFGRGL